MADTTKGYGSVLAFATTFAGSYANLAQVRDITDPGVTIAEVDTSHMQSFKQAKEKEADWISAENLTFQMLYTQSQHTLLWNLAVSRANVFFRLTTPDGKIQIFEGFVAKIGREIPMEGRITAPVEIAVSGLPTFS